MNHTLSEQERAAWIAGDSALLQAIHARQDEQIERREIADLVQRINELVRSMEQRAYSSDWRIGNEEYKILLEHIDSLDGIIYDWDIDP